MAASDMGGFLGGWLAFEDRKQQMAERERANAAYNALADIYGPVAGDPVSYGQLAGIKRAEDRAPLELRGLELNNEAAEVGLDQSQQLFPYTLDQARLGNVKTGQDIQQSADRFPLEQEARRANIEGTRVGTEGARLGNEGTRMGLDLAGEQRRQAALMMGVRALTHARDTGGDLGATFDRLLPVMADMGIPAEEIAQARELIIADPTTLDDITAALTDPAMAKGTKAKADGEAGQTEADKYYDRNIAKQAADAEAKAYDVARTNEQKMAGFDQRMTQLDSVISDSLDHEDFDTPFGIQGRIEREFPGSAAADAWNRLQTVKNVIRLDVLADLKSLSETGGAVGQVSNEEGRVMEGYLGQLDAASSPEEARRVLGLIKERRKQLTERLRAASKRDTEIAQEKAKGLYDRMDERARRAKGEKTPTGGRGGAVPLPPELSGAAEGTVIEADDGTPYVVRGGQLVPQ